MVDIKLIFLALGLIISLSAAYYSLKVFDKTKANISTKKIIDSTQEKKRLLLTNYRYIFLDCLLIKKKQKIIWLEQVFIASLLLKPIIY